MTLKFKNKNITQIFEEIDSIILSKTGYRTSDFICEFAKNNFNFENELINLFLEDIINEVCE